MLEHNQANMNSHMYDDQENKNMNISYVPTSPLRAPVKGQGHSAS